MDRKRRTWTTETTKSESQWFSGQRDADVYCEKLIQQKNEVIAAELPIGWNIKSNDDIAEG